jgi:uncharacterized membrane protein YgcG
MKNPMLKEKMVKKRLAFSKSSGTGKRSIRGRSCTQKSKPSGWSSGGGQRSGGPAPSRDANTAKPVQP